MHTPMRAARLPGQSTLWTRTLDRLLCRMPERRPVTASADGPDAVHWPPPIVAGIVTPVDPVEPRAPVAPPTWTAPRHLPELLTDPRGDRRPARFALAR